MSSRLAGLCFLSSQQNPVLRHEPQPGSVPPGCGHGAPMLGRVLQRPLLSPPAPRQGKEAKKIPLPARCSLPRLEKIRIN